MLPHFITVANGEPRDPAVVRAGNEGVIRARYSDAAFFVEHDRRQPLAEFTPKLATLTFQEQLGSMLDKVQRLEKLAPWLAEQLGLSAADQATVARAAALCKSDLATSMVIEMTSLQGIMGREYALASGESPAVAQAIFEHYLPRSSGDRRPQSLPGLVLGLANRLDSIAGLFAVGLDPSGSADPFGLRRDALGIVQNLAEAGISFPVSSGLAQAAALLPVPANPEAVAQRRRLHHRPAGELAARRGLSLRRGAGRAGRAGRRSGGGPPDRGRAGRVVAATRLAGHADRLCALQAHRAQPARTLPADALAMTRSRRRRRCWPLTSQSTRPQDVAAVAGRCESLVDPINTFFDKVMVMAEDETLRRARLSLLQAIAALPDGVADLSKLQGF